MSNFMIEPQPTLVKNEAPILFGYFDSHGIIFSNKGTALNIAENKVSNGINSGQNILLI